MSSSSKVNLSWEAVDRRRPWATQDRCWDIDRLVLINEKESKTLTTGNVSDPFVYDIENRNCDRCPYLSHCLLRRCKAFSRDFQPNVRRKDFYSLTRLLSTTDKPDRSVSRRKPSGENNLAIWKMHQLANDLACGVACEYRD